MFKTRLLSGIVLVILALFFIVSGGYILLGSTLLISLIGLFEFYRVFKIHNHSLGYVGYVATVLYYASISLLPSKTTFPILIGFLIVLLAFYVFRYPKYEIREFMASYFGIFYVSVMLSYIYQTRMIEGIGAYLVWLIFLCSWGCDTCAYCVGVLFGKHKMAPVLSPKKSIEGAVGGVVGSALLTALYGYIFKNAMAIDTKEIIILSCGACVGALISMIGDLAASAIKRNNDIKDYGKLIPGHGGILDRFDSVIITAPIIFYLGGFI